MQIHELKNPINRKAKKRVGRGIAAGQGKTAGRGTKGQNSRSGAKIPLTFEGGQLSFAQRFPKLRGFKNIFKTPTLAINLDELALIKKSEIKISDILALKGVKSTKVCVKILSNGEGLKAKIFANSASKSAIEKVKKAGGEIVIEKYKKTIVVKNKSKSVA